MEKFKDNILILLLIVVGMLVSSGVFKILYNWFIVTTYNITPISFTQSLGIVLMLNYIKPNAKKDNIKKDLKFYENSVIEKVKWSLTLLIIAYLIHLLQN